MIRTSTDRRHDTTPEFSEPWLKDGVLPLMDGWGFWFLKIQIIEEKFYSSYQEYIIVHKGVTISLLDLPNR